MSDEDTASEKMLTDVIISEIITGIKGYDPGYYRVVNKTGRSDIIFAQSPDRAQAIFYMYHGTMSPITDIEKVSGDIKKHQAAKKVFHPQKKLVDFRKKRRK